MSDSESFAFGTRAQRGYDHEATERFPWPVVAGYDEVHRWMDEDLAVNAAWQLRDCWEGLIKFLGTLAIADHLGAAPLSEDRSRRLLATLVVRNPRGLSLGHWAETLMLALKDNPHALRLLRLKELLF